ncbi:MAG: ribokinase [Lactobacillus helsingborgensis]|uniref:ribokinase n=1 Tax=Lactobacillus helsingborgensis TaxID=1218494 RepID=UPI001CC6077B|nr:ribokinase [Lactobacillus helsingborgensis]MCT6811680.1 ribokinase [Lactobacillus helsingborgensis]
MSINISVLGSINLDTTYHITHIPLPGETLQVNKKTYAGGGKGANQAVAAQRSGATVHFIGAVGNDTAGKFMLETMGKENIDLANVEVKENEQTGAATILLDKNGQNSILVYAGANSLISHKQIVKAEDVIAKSQYIIAQFETPIKATLEAFKIAKKHNVITILNPAPAAKISDELLELTDIITPNETESAFITGIKVKDQNAMHETDMYFKKKGVKVTLITLGSRGVHCSIGSISQLVPAHKVHVVDTTGAGDTFVGAMASILKPDFSNIFEAIDYGQKASSITIEVMGAQPSIPTREKVEQVYGKED